MTICCALQEGKATINLGMTSKSARIRKRRKSQLGTGKKLIETWIVREACDRASLKVLGSETTLRLARPDSVAQQGQVVLQQCPCICNEAGTRAITFGLQHASCDSRALAAISDIPTYKAVLTAEELWGCLL